MGYSTLVRSEISWKASRSPETTTTSAPALSARCAPVAMMSSASKPSTVIHGMFRVSRVCWMYSICPANSSGVFCRPPLYSGYSSERKVGPDRSKATATWVGRSCRIMVSSIAVNPCTALVCCPAVVTKDPSGTA